MRKESTVFVFSGQFSSRAEACLYSEPQWEPEPDENATNEDYAAWEDRNPTHQLKRNINHYLDHDFIETIDDMNEMSRHQYLEALLKHKNDIETIKAVEPHASNILVLVFREAFDGLDLNVPPTSTEELTYCGEYLCFL